MLSSVVLSTCLLAGTYGFLLDSKPKQVCYGDLGCFSDSAPFTSVHRQINFLPKGPDVIQTTFYLYTRDTPSSGDEEIISITDNTKAVNLSHFSASRKTKVIVHGFTHNAHRQWISNLVAELLKNEDLNVIAVDWQSGAGLPYGQATANTRLVGAQIAQLVNYLISSLDATPDMFHIIGHSLGAHVAGYAGERIQNLGRISALDPAGPYFEGTAPAVRLDPADAQFVDVIHTDGSSLLSLGLGTDQAMGHVDFFPNGGWNQPGCDDGVLKKLGHTAWNAVTLDKYGAEAAIACSHERSYYLYTESINAPCPFTAYPCTSDAEFNKGLCLKCLGNQCSRMGYHADKSQARGSLYLDTQDSPTYCNYHYQVNITTDNAMDGIVKITLHGAKGDSAEIPLTDDNEVHTARSTITHLVTTRKDLGELTRMTVSYDKTGNILTSWIYSDKWELMGMTTFAGETQQLLSYCAYGKSVTNHLHVDFATSGHCD